jgi:hypothetical protein
MNKEVAKKWVKALRSGEYKQGINVLNRDNKEFCCLGVLCELAAKEGVVSSVVEVRDLDAASDLPCYSYDGEASFLPESVVNWAKLKAASQQAEFTYMNDFLRYTFDKIADYIESKWINV